ncbi:MAG: glutamine synthetase family protein [Lachnospiraceae bacterium]|nr:glutamine synthetase family protein [Lachnospiraceae bacterium]
MNYSKDEVLAYTQEEDVKFIRLTFCDVFGKQKNVAIMPDELPRAFEYGISFDSSAISGFGDEVHSDLLLHPEPGTLMPFPWRPEHGRVVQMFSNITRPDGTPFPCDTRSLLKRAVSDASKAGLEFTFGAEEEFYLFNLDEKGRPTLTPCDNAGYMDIAPEDRGENVRREICLTLEQMGIRPESSHHEEGPGQNEIDFRYADAMTVADNAMTFQRVVKTVAHRNGLAADFSPKPLEGAPGNGLHVNMSVRPFDNGEAFSGMIAGILKNIEAMTAFLNPTENSYKRLGNHKAPRYISWSHENRSQLIRVPAASGEYRRAELRSPDPLANPYLAFALLIYAGIDGITNKLPLCGPSDINLYTAGPEVLASCKKLPETLSEACAAASSSDFIKAHIPPEILSIYCRKKELLR